MTMYSLDPNDYGGGPGGCAEVALVLIVVLLLLLAMADVATFGDTGQWMIAK